MFKRIHYTRLQYVCVASDGSNLEIIVQSKKVNYPWTGRFANLLAIRQNTWNSRAGKRARASSKSSSNIRRYSELKDMYRTYIFVYISLYKKQALSAQDYHSLMMTGKYVRN